MNARYSWAVTVSVAYIFFASENSFLFVAGRLPQKHRSPSAVSTRKGLPSLEAVEYLVRDYYQQINVLDALPDIIEHISEPMRPQPATTTPEHNMNMSVPHQIFLFILSRSLLSFSSILLEAQIWWEVDCFHRK